MPRRQVLPVDGDGTKLAEMIDAVIYARVSTKEQTEKLSLPTQLRACEEYCRRQRYDVVERSTKRARALILEPLLLGTADRSVTLGCYRPDSTDL